MLRYSPLAIALTYVSVFAFACDGANQSQLGVTLSADGQVEVIHHPCRATTLAYDLYVEPRGSLEPIWRITSANPSGRRVFVIGMTPPEYEEVVPLREPIPDTFIVAITNEPNGRLKSSVDVEQFALADIRSDAVFVPRRGHMSREAFVNSNTCD